MEIFNLYTICGALMSSVILLLLARHLGCQIFSQKRGASEIPPPAHFLNAKWCPLCRGKLRVAQICGRTRLACTRRGCRYVHWDSPKPVVVCVVEVDGRIVLVRRAIEPAIGQWCIPGGYIEAGETAEDAAARECFEETGLIVKIVSLIGAYAPCHDVNEIILVYKAVVEGGSVDPGDEESEVGMFNQSELPEDIAFDQHRRIIAHCFDHTVIKPAELDCRRH